MKENTCCFSGHRPEKMNVTEKELRNMLEKVINEAVENGYTKFITGMAMGTDILAGEIVVEKKEIYSHLQLICALPHPNFEKSRSENEQLRFQRIIEKADSVELINKTYFRGCYQLRNKWMVDHSNLLIVFFNGSKGGTKNALDYANKKGICIKNICDI